MIVVADTSGLIAALNRSDPEHDAARSALDSAGLVVVSPLTMTEVDQVTSMRAGRALADNVMRVVMRRCLDGRAELAATSPEVILAGVRVRQQYQDLDLDLVDAVNVVLTAAYQTNAVLTLDRRDFRAVRPLTEHAAFKLLPDDLY